MLNKLNATEIIELMERVENTLGTNFVGNEANTIDLIFFKCFGMDWDKNQLYKEFREYVNKSMCLIKAEYGSCYLVTM